MNIKYYFCKVFQDWNKLSLGFTLCLFLFLFTISLSSTFVYAAAPDNLYHAWEFNDNPDDVNGTADFSTNGVSYSSTAIEGKSGVLSASSDYFSTNSITGNILDEKIGRAHV